VTAAVTHDRARQLGKAYVAAINGGPEPFAALFAPDAAVTVEGAPSSPRGVLASAPAGRCWYRGVRAAPPGFIVVVRVLDRDAAVEQTHEIALAADGLIARLRTSLGGPNPGPPP
jgi:hypothetical protein